MRVYISVDMEGIAGVSHPKPTSRTDSEYPAAVDADGRRGERGDRRRVRGRGDRHPRQRQPRRDVQPDARSTSTRPRGSSRARRPWSMVAGAGPARRRAAVRRGPVRRLPRPRRPPDRDDRPHLHRRPGRDAPERPPDRRVRLQRPGPRGLGRARRARRRRRRAGRRGRGLAALGRAGRGQGGLRLERRRRGPPERCPRSDPGRRDAGRRTRDGRAS